MHFERLTHPSQVQDLISFHNLNSNFCVLDVETDSVNPRIAQIVDIQLSGRSQDEAAIIDKQFAGLLRQFDPKVTLVAHNYKYDAHVLFRHGVDLLSYTWRDTMLLGHIANENRESFSLDSYVKEMGGGNYKEAFWEKYKSYAEAPEAERIEYACKDIYWTRRLYLDLTTTLEDDQIPGSLISHIHKLQRSLLRTEIDGVRVDLGFLTQAGIEIKTKIESLRPQMRAAVKIYCQLWEMSKFSDELEKRTSERGKKGYNKFPAFSFDSDSQVKWLIYDQLKLPVQKNPKTKQPSTSSDALEALKDAHPIVPLLIDYGSLPRIYSTFIEGVQERMVQGRIYPEFHMVDRESGMKTSRISHRNPNTGNMPSYLKGIYAPDAGDLFSEHDYSQLEVCIEAHYTQDKNLLAIIFDNASKHDITAHNLGIKRDLAKTLNFGMQYRCSHFKVAKLLGVSEAEGQLVWNKYWETYSGVAALQKATDRLLDAGEAIVDLFGRKRRFEHKKRSPWDQAYRQAYNFKIQSSGGQLMNNAFYKADDALRALGRGKGVLTVHDSGLFAHKASYCEVDYKIPHDFMVAEGVLAGLTVPLKVVSKVGGIRWGEYTLDPEKGHG